MALSKLNVRKTTDLMAELQGVHVTAGHLVESLTEVLRLPLSRLIRWYWDSSMSPSVAGVSVHLHRDTDGSSRQARRPPVHHLLAAVPEAGHPQGTGLRVMRELRG